MAFDLHTDERLDDLQVNGLQIIQSEEVFSFSIDAILLARYVSLKRQDRVLDIGTGNGVIPLLLTTRHTQRRTGEIVALEYQERLAEMARRNVAGNGLDDIIRVVQGDARQAVELFGREKFDVVTCNPPYRPAGVGDQSLKEPIKIARHEITLTLEQAIASAASMCRFEGKVAMVHRPDRVAEIFALMRSYRLEPKRMLLVHPRLDRRPNIVVVEAIKGGRPELKIDPPFVVHNADGSYTQAMLDIYAGRGEFAK
ncbi:MAG TPA: tRNA1(Val) (adenine(37)-N6)-methyltransferase [Bacilli bacterium]|nr:tRNA1(Val) (adenine(37)-N6)-methyltransferase [Bacilli bacterium]